MRSDAALRSLRCALASLLLVALATGQGWVARNVLTSPPARNSHGLANDSARGVTVLFGGYNGGASAFGDTWEWNGFGWGQRVTPTAPLARWGHSMVYDTRRSRMVLFGGYAPTGAGGMQADTWEWDGIAWTQRVLPVQPPARGYFGMAYDSWRGQVLVFGGVDAANQHLDDTWAFDGVAWTQVATATRPSARRGVAMAFDDTRGQTVLFGGGDGAQVFGDTWVFDGANWVAQPGAGGPSARQEARLAHDGRCGKAVLHGGADNSYSTNYGDSWAWDGSTWVAVAGASPTGRHGAGLAFDARRGQMLLWGGRHAGGFFADAWQLASGCSRTMSVVIAPQLLMPAVFRYSYPPAAAGHFGVHLLTLHQAGGFAVPIPGFSSFGECFVDLFSVQLQTFSLLDASGVSDLAVQMPGDPYLVGLAFDVQAVDVSFQASAVYWAGNDAEVAIAPLIPPVASFTATPTSGTAPLAVQFTDTSTNGPTSWQWDFNNDGVVDSTLQNPAFTYTVAGLYSVRLVAANFGGSGASLRSSLINAGPQIPSPVLNMVPILAGTFQMGSTGWNSSEEPVHSVSITRPFWIGRYEVTQAQYQSVMGNNPSYFQGPVYPNAAQRPVERASWNDAMAYCGALTAAEAAAGRIPSGYQYRLPTEAEWEYCCRAGTTTDYSLGASVSCGLANFYDGVSNNYCVGATAIVGSYAANPWGLFDTHGNVWEWCLDSWDGWRSYPSSAISDPYMSDGSNRILRGGGWDGSVDGGRSASRNWYDPGTAAYSVGFRVVLAPVLVPSPALNMVRVEAGVFQMGSPESSLGTAPYYNQVQAQPVHSVSITRPFWVGRHEVTQAAYQAVMGANPSLIVGPQRPVESVTWHGAMAYCAAITASEAAAGRVPLGYQYRLPTEAEWEYCYRAGTTTEYWFGQTISCGMANFSHNNFTNSSCSVGQTSDVGSFPANPWGLRDIAGNVHEWCLDAWDGSANYPSSSVLDPYVSSGPLRIFRGGSWSNDSSRCRAAMRLGVDPGAASIFNIVGFRVVLAPVLVP